MSSPWAAWKAMHDREWVPDPPRVLVRIAVTVIPDDVRCSLFGDDDWGVMHTEHQLREGAINVVRLFIPDNDAQNPRRRPLVGRFTPFEYVFVPLEWYEAMLALQSLPPVKPRG